MSFFTTPERHRARKQHVCSLCSRTIEPGEVYERVRGYDSGDAWTFKSCAHCDAVSLIFDPQDIYDEGISADSYQGWLENGARDLAELRAMAGYRMRWRARSGNLLPVPARESHDSSKENTVEGDRG